MEHKSDTRPLAPLVPLQGGAPRFTSFAFVEAPVSAPAPPPITAPTTTPTGPPISPTAAPVAAPPAAPPWVRSGCVVPQRAEQDRDGNHGRCPHRLTLQFAASIVTEGFEAEPSTRISEVREGGGAFQPMIVSEFDAKIWRSWEDLGSPPSPFGIQTIVQQTTVYRPFHKKVGSEASLLPIGEPGKRPLAPVEARGGGVGSQGWSKDRAFIIGS